MRFRKLRRIQGERVSTYKATKSMSSAKILIVEDDSSIADIVAYNLRQVPYDVSICHDGAEGLKRVIEERPDLLILDLMLPSLDGIEICRQLRANPGTKDLLILMLTAKSEEADQVTGFSVNTDDYVTKPFSVKILLERIRILLQRRGTSMEGNVISRQGIVIDRIRHTVSANSKPLDLTFTEFMILETLMSQPGHPFQRVDLIEAARGGEKMVFEQTIDVPIQSLRKKLGPAADLIETVRGVGYRFHDP